MELFMLRCELARVTGERDGYRLERDLLIEAHKDCCVIERSLLNKNRVLSDEVRDSQSLLRRWHGILNMFVERVRAGAGIL